MRAIHIPAFVPSPSHLRTTTLPPPTPPTPTALHIQITHAALTHVDLLYALGLHQNNKRHVKPPFILGTEFAGTVLSAPKASGFASGDRVFGSGAGAYAEEISVEAGSVRRMPEGWTNAEACAVGGSGAVSRGAFDAVGVRPRETVLVLGASGGLGVMAVQIARALEAGRVVGLVDDVDGEKGRVVKGLGAEVVRYGDGWEKRVLELTGGKGVDVVYDSIGAVDKSLKCLAYGGRIVVVGFAARGGNMENVAMNKVLLKGASIIGYRFGEQNRRDPKKTEAIWSAFMTLVSQGDIKPVVYSEIYQGLDSIPRALGDLAERKLWGRAIVDIAESRSRL